MSHVCYKLRKEMIVKKTKEFQCSSWGEEGMCKKKNQTQTINYILGETPIYSAHVTSKLSTKMVSY